MTINLSKRILSKLLVLGVLIGASVSAPALSANASPSDGELLSAGSVYKASGTLHYGQGIGLGAGKITQNQKTKSLDLIERADHSPDGIHATYEWGVVSVRVAYQITRFGQPTDYWIQAGFTRTDATSAYGLCEVFQGEPGSHGAKDPVWTSPFQCETSRRGLDNDWDYKVSPAGAIAESSGSIHTDGTVSLVQGEFADFGYSWFSPGDSVVNKTGQTDFTTVLLAGERAKISGGARTEFQYTIVDNGALTYYTLFGGTTSFGEEKCYVIPMGRYECAASGHSMSSSGWHTTFTVRGTQTTPESAVGSH